MLYEGQSEEPETLSLDKRRYFRRHESCVAMSEMSDKHRNGNYVSSRTHTKTS